MERWKSDVPDSVQTSASGMIGEYSRQSVHRRPGRLPIRVRIVRWQIFKQRFIGFGGRGPISD